MVACGEAMRMRSGGYFRGCVGGLGAEWDSGPGGWIAGVCLSFIGDQESGGMEDSYFRDVGAKKSVY